MDCYTDTETIKDAIRLMRARYRRLKAQDKAPDEPCQKCGGTCWQNDDAIGHWYCFKCGNRGFWEGGKFIDIWGRKNVLGN